MAINVVGDFVLVDSILGKRTIEFGPSGRSRAFSSQAKLVGVPDGF